jgi:hypothetical protein
LVSALPPGTVYVAVSPEPNSAGAINSIIEDPSAPPPFILDIVALIAVVVSEVNAFLVNNQAG